MHGGKGKKCILNQQNKPKKKKAKKKAKKNYGY